MTLTKLVSLAMTILRGYYRLELSARVTKNWIINPLFLKGKLDGTIKCPLLLKVGKLFSICTISVLFNPSHIHDLR